MTSLTAQPTFERGVSVIIDDPSLLAIVTKELERLHIQVHYPEPSPDIIVKSGDELVIIEFKRTHPQLINFVKNIKQLDTYLKVIAISPKFYEKEAQEAGVDEFIDGTFLPEYVLRKKFHDMVEKFYTISSDTPHGEKPATDNKGIKTHQKGDYYRLSQKELEELVFLLSPVLFSNPSFFEGLGRVFDFYGSLNNNTYSPLASPEENDALAILSDWIAVGNDIRYSISNFEPHTALIEK